MTATGLERVYVVNDYYDGPRSGVADFNGQPHAFLCVFDRTQDEWSDVYLLKAIDQETLEQAEESFAIFLRWERAFRAGLASRESHPCLPSERSRYELIQTRLRTALSIDERTALTARGVFVGGGPTAPAILPNGVMWSPAPIPALSTQSPDAARGEPKAVDLQWAPEEIKRFCEEEGEWVLDLPAEMSAETLQSLYFRQLQAPAFFGGVIHEIASHPRTPVDVLGRIHARFGADDDAMSALATNPGTPDEILNALAAHSSEVVREHAHANISRRRSGASPADR